MLQYLEQELRSVNAVLFTKLTINILTDTYVWSNLAPLFALPFFVVKWIHELI